MIAAQTEGSFFHQEGEIIYQEGYIVNLQVDVCKKCGAEKINYLWKIENLSTVQVNWTMLWNSGRKPVKSGS